MVIYGTNIGANHKQKQLKFFLSRSIKIDSEIYFLLEIFFSFWFHLSQNCGKSPYPISHPPLAAKGRYKRRNEFVDGSQLNKKENL